MQGIGTEIKKRRKKVDLTLKALAGKIGVTGSFLSQIEKGKAAPSLATLKKIADALNADGIPTKQGSRWYAQTVKDVLSNSLNEAA
jgi:transcriptional regulator with XRE-family HTH domain